ncbi:hypothetical protein OUZ56_011027 [Daphnia magna]|uniref:Uncharacterized protein n=1 Tax=Daphnia magna TaxID=35525 RepID=A0ABQ9YZ80_9CRUS|nr:hypothetical protein OUZ56_011027 [Daphnia magna]
MTWSCPFYSILPPISFPGHDQNNIPIKRTLAIENDTGTPTFDDKNRHLLNDCQRLWASSVVHVEHIESGGLYDFAWSHLVKDCSNTSLLHYQLFDSFDQDCGLQL